MTTSPADAAAALAAGRWQAAIEAFAPLAAAGDPSAQEGMAQAAWWLDDADVAIGARQAAYRGFRAAGDDRGAARVAATLGYDTLLFGGGVAVARGWLARAADLLDGRIDVAEAGWLAVRRAEVALAVDHDAEEALRAAAQAGTIGREVGDEDLASVGRALTGLSRVRLGQVGAGVAELDAAVGAATAGDVTDLMWAGKICCWLITACQETGDFARAGEWCARVAHLSEERDLAPLSAVCRTQYAAVLLARGDCAEAESALADVLTELEHSRRVGRLDAVAHLGELRRRQGRRAEAESLLRQVGFHPVALCGLALSRLAEGDTARAQTVVSELLRALRPGQLERAGVLAVAVRVAVSSGQHARARAAADELRGMAVTVGAEAFLARAAVAEALLAGHRDAAVDAAGDTAEDAVGLWQDAARHFRAAGLPFDEAECRVELAELLDRQGDPAAGEQAAAALDLLLPSLQGAPVAVRAEAILHGDNADNADNADDGPLTARQIDVLRLLADGLSNAQIAAALHLSEHTVHRHVSNIYAALGLTSRAAAATYAVRRGLTREA
ncbi:LuxR C-terminal-related transcriptional regulator [uncultured Jatrophihabitans sp.]|uniref:LuxR C-terminal-related transcriptional regulator n=1 Tax=uncultured Jatrophihabitans sp. TaxID=1610747 RepID=UPI0035CB2B76